MSDVERISERLQDQAARLGEKITEAWQGAEEALDIGRDADARELITGAEHMEAEREIIQRTASNLAG